MNETVTKADIVKACHFLTEVGLGTSTSGNVSGRVGDRICLTATGVSLGDATEENLAEMSPDGEQLNDVAPTKEAGFHLAIYRSRPHVNAIVHVHPPNTIAAAALVDGEAPNLPAMTPQFVMRAGLVPVLPYHAPGTTGLVDAVAECDAQKAFVLANHGAAAFGPSFRKALGTIEELEQNCKIFVLTGGRGRTLDEAQVKDLLSRSM